MYMYIHMKVLCGFNFFVRGKGKENVLLFHYAFSFKQFTYVNIFHFFPSCKVGFNFVHFFIDFQILAVKIDIFKPKL